MRIACLLLCCLGLFSTCSVHLDSAETVPQVESSPRIAELSVPWTLPPPRSTSAHTPPSLPQYITDGQLFFGAYAVQAFTTQRVTADRQVAVFEPQWQNQSDSSIADVAYAIYDFNLALHDGPHQVKLYWQDFAPASSNVHVGVADFSTNRWRWFAVAGSMLAELGVADPLVNSEGHALVVVVVTGTQSARLEEIIYGNRLVVEEIDFSQFFSPPLAFEMTDVESDWATRDTKAYSANIEAQIELPDGHRKFVISHLVGENRHYGLLRIPPHAPGQQLPMVVICHGGTSSADYTWLEQFDGLFDTVEQAHEFIVLLPSFRGEYIIDLDLGNYQSDGIRSVYDHDTDDALALINAVFELFAEASQDTILSYGFSRGGQVTQRIAQRDPRVKGCIVFAGMTDEWTHWGQSASYYMATEMEDVEPGLAYAWHHMLWDLRYGAHDVWAARMVQLRTSTSYFADRSPRVQAHYGELDQAIHIDQGERLFQVMQALGRDDLEYFTYPDGQHDLFLNMGSRERAREFLLSFVSSE